MNKIILGDLMLVMRVVDILYIIGDICKLMVYDIVLYFLFL